MSAATWHWPQWTILALLLLRLVMAARNIRDGVVLAGFATAVFAEVAVLWVGGFFG